MSRRDQQRLADYLGHILQAIERIERYTEDLGEVEFLEDEMAQDAVIQAQADPDRTNAYFAAIPIERTRDTGLKHLDGTVSMA